MVGRERKPNAPASKASFRQLMFMKSRSGQPRPRSPETLLGARTPVVPAVWQSRRKRGFVARDKQTQEDAGPGAQLVPEQAAFAALVLNSAAGTDKFRTRPRGSYGAFRMVRKDSMERAIKEAKARKVPLLSTELRKIARVHDVPETTFLTRMRKNDPFAIPKLGRPSLTTRESREAVAHAAARADELQQGMSVKMIIDTMEELHPELTRKQLTNVWQHHIKKDPILTGRVVGDQTTDRRANAITELGQRQWFNIVGAVRADLAHKSAQPGVDEDGNEITYKSVLRHFVVGGDEECVLLSSDTGKIIGKKGNKKHLVKAGDSRKSATAFHNGSAAGVKGPTLFILPGDTQTGVKKSKVYNDFVVKRGAPLNSLVLWNEKAYMTEELWDDNIKQLAQGIRAMDPLIMRNPHWWVEYHLDGFGAHVNTRAAQRELAEHKIAVIQSQSHSSHVNQSFDDEPAKHSKAGQRDAYVPPIFHCRYFLTCHDWWFILIF